MCSYKSITIFSMSKEDIIIDEKKHPINPLYFSNQTKLIINSNVNKNQISKHIWFLFSNDGSCEPVKTCH